MRTSVLDNQFASQGFSNQFRYGETKPDTILVDMVFDVKLREHFADETHVLYANAFISDFDLDHSLISLLPADTPALDMHRPFHRVLNTIGYQVSHNLAYSQLVLVDFGVKAKLRDQIRHAQFEMQAFLGDLIGK